MLKLVLMRTVNIAELKAGLSAHIQLVQEGEEIVVCERNKPVARIVPFDWRNQSDREKRLIARGVLLPPRKKRTGTARWPNPPGQTPDETVVRVWQEERENR
jgi:antitoxin (DNA-binding transcriptional repressor) of toxin-antitoxin stability system